MNIKTLLIVLLAFTFSLSAMAQRAIPDSTNAHKYVEQMSNTPEIYHNIFYPNSKHVKLTGATIDDKRIGSWRGYYMGDKLRVLKIYKNDKLTDSLTEFHINGQLKRKVWFDAYGMVKKEINYDENGIPTTEPMPVLNYVDQEPKAPYDYQAFISKYITKLNLQSSGTLYMNIIVDEDGDIVGVIPARKGQNKSLEKQVARILSMMPRWEPAMKDGFAVKAYYRIPIKFINN